MNASLKNKFKNWCFENANPLTPRGGRTEFMFKDSYGLEIVITNSDFFGDNQQKMFVTIRHIQSSGYIALVSDEEKEKMKEAFMPKLIKLAKDYGVTYPIGYCKEELEEALQC